MMGEKLYHVEEEEEREYSDPPAPGEISSASHSMT
jgi:hypothetical protein